MAFGGEKPFWRSNNVIDRVNITRSAVYVIVVTLLLQVRVSVV